VSGPATPCRPESVRCRFQTWRPACRGLPRIVATVPRAQAERCRAGSAGSDRTHAPSRAGSQPVRPPAPFGCGPASASRYPGGRRDAGAIVPAAVTRLPNAVAAIYLARRGRAAATRSEAMNSNTLNVLAGLLKPAADGGRARGGRPGVSPGRITGSGHDRKSRWIRIPVYAPARPPAPGAMPVGPSGDAGPFRRLRRSSCCFRAWLGSASAPVSRSPATCMRASSPGAR